MPLTPEQYVVVLIASVLGSFGTAGVPGTAVIMATVVLSAANLPLETIGYLYAIDRILDMMRTMTNVTGQMLVPVLVAKETGLLDQAVYDNPSSNVGVDDPDRLRHAAEVAWRCPPDRRAFCWGWPTRCRPRAFLVDPRHAWRERHSADQRSAPTRRSAVAQ